MFISQSSDEKIKLVQVDYYTVEDCEMNEKVSVTKNSSEADEIDLLVGKNKRSIFISMLEDSLEQNVIQDKNNIVSMNEFVQVSLDDYHILRIVFSCVCKENIYFHIICAASKFKNSTKFLKEDTLTNHKSTHCSKLLMSFNNYSYVE